MGGSLGFGVRGSWAQWGAGKVAYPRLWMRNSHSARRTKLLALPPAVGFGMLRSTQPLEFD